MLTLFYIYSPSRFVGFNNDEDSLNAEVLRKYIFGGHVADYMRHLQEEDEDKYKSHFSRFIAKGITADGVSVFACVCVLLCVCCFVCVQKVCLCII